MSPDILQLASNLIQYLSIDIEHICLMSIPTIIQPCSAWSTSRSCTESFQTWLVCTSCHYSLCECAHRNWVSFQYLQSSGLLVSPLIFAPQQLWTTVVIWCTRSFCSTSSEIHAICPYFPISIHSSTLHLNTVAHGKYKFWWLWRACWSLCFSSCSWNLLQPSIQLLACLLQFSSQVSRSFKYTNSPILLVFGQDLKNN